MLRFSGRRRRQMMVNAEINITNLVDVAFVLLIIFMITAPILQGGIEVQLPEAYAAPLTDAETILVSVDAKGDVFVEKVRAADEAEFRLMLEARKTGDPEMSVTLKGDQRINLGRWLEVIGIIKDLGIERLNLPVEPRRR